MAEGAVTRVVIACDPVGENRACIELAARFASWIDAALRAVFVEDEALLHLAAFPFARHVGAGGEIFSSIDEQAVQHQFEAHAARLRSTLAAAAAASDVGWTFDVIRGPLALATLGLDERDLLVIAAASRPFAGALRLDSRWVANALASHRPTLLLRNGSAASHEVVALIENAASMALLVSTAAKLAMAGERSLVLLLANDEVDATAALEIVHSISDAVAARCRIARLPTRQPAAQAKAGLESIATAGRLLIVDADPATRDAAALKTLLAMTRADILFLR